MTKKEEKKPHSRLHSVRKAIKEGAGKAKAAVHKFVEEHDNRRMMKDIGKDKAHKEKVKHMSKEEREEGARKAMGLPKKKVAEVPGYMKSMAKEMAATRAQKEKVKHMSKEERAKEFDKGLRRGSFTK